MEDRQVTMASDIINDYYADMKTKFNYLQDCWEEIPLPQANLN